MRWTQCKGNRIKRYGLGVTVEGMWWSERDKTWSGDPQPPGSNMAACRTFHR